MRLLMKWTSMVIFVGLLLAVSVYNLDATVRPRRTMRITYTMTPSHPRVGEPTVITAKVVEKKNETAKVKITFGCMKGLSLVSGQSETPLVLSKNKPVELQFGVKFENSPAEFCITGGYVYEGPVREPIGWPDGPAGATYLLYDKDQRFYHSYTLHKMLQPEDPVVQLQREFGFSDVGNMFGYSYMRAASLNEEINDFTKAKGISREEAINLIKSKADTLAKERKIKKEKAYEAIYKERLLWKDSGLPDPHKNRKPPNIQGKIKINNRSGGSGCTSTAVSGYWFYDDHEYDWQTGLQTSPGDTTRPIRRCFVEVWDIGDDDHQYPLQRAGYTTTDYNGHFVVSIDNWPNHQSAYHAKLVIKAKGPSTAFTTLMVKKPTGDSLWEYWTDFYDIWPDYGRDFPNLHPPRYDAANDRQPISGAWNIYDAMFRATQRVGNPLSPTIVKAIWAPGCTLETVFSSPDSIIINGDTASWTANEWDDDVVQHEYGHFVYYNWLGYTPSGYDTDHYWFKPYDPDYRNTAFIEGWAHFLSGLVRDSVMGQSWGQGDSMIVITNGRIGNSDTTGRYYWCLENPWHFHYWNGAFDSTNFGAGCGPWCEGAIAATLYDILDRYQEAPYVPHPKLPEWPDTSLYDTLRTSSYLTTSPIIQIVKNKIINGHGVETIYDFLSGWLHPPGNGGTSYGHWAPLLDILEHHRIPWSKPPCPESLTVRLLQVAPRKLYASWHTVYKGPHILGYNVYRAVDGASPQYSQLTTYLVTDTFYVDSTIAGGTVYRYFVTSVDSLDCESDSSQSATVQTGPSSEDYRSTAANNALKILRDGQRMLHVAYTDSGGCYYVNSSDSGQNWSTPLSLGAGRYPTLALDGNDSMHAVWVKQAGSSPDTEAQVLYSHRHGNGTWTTPVVIAKRAGGTPPNLTPPAIVMRSDSARVTFETCKGGGFTGPQTNWWYALYHGTFSIAQPESAVWQRLDTLSANISAGWCPRGETYSSLAVDDTGKSHVVWHRLGSVRYFEQISDTTWASQVDLSEGDYYCNNSSCNLSGTRLGVVWAVQHDCFQNAVCYRSRLLDDTVWGAPETLSADFVDAIYPFLSVGPSVVFSASSYEPHDVYLTHRGDNGWTTPENVESTTPESGYPHLFTTQLDSSRVSDVLWTEGDAAPYELPYKQVTSSNPPMPWFEAVLGRSKPSSFARQRDGYFSFGSPATPNQTRGVDLGISRSLVYEMSGLKPKSKHRLQLVGYFEWSKEFERRLKGFQTPPGPDAVVQGGPASDASNSQGTSDAVEMKIQEEVLVNGVAVGTLTLGSGKPATLDVRIPDKLCSSGKLRIEVRKRDGAFVAVGKLALYQYEVRGAPNGSAAPQGGELLSGLLPREYALSQSYPNPTKEGVRINYALPRESRVNLKVYNIAGQLVRMLRDGKEKPGYFTAEWDGRDHAGRRVASGVYLYRIEAGTFTKTRKLVVVR